MNRKENVIFVTGHPDDVAFSMGGTAALLKDKYNLYIICLSSGGKGYKWDGKGIPPENQKLIEQREQEELNSATLINASVSFMHEPDGEIFAHKDLCHKVADIISEKKPVAVFTMGFFEKPDHSATCQVARQALYLSKRFWETEFYMLVPYNHSNIFNPSIYVNITDVVEEKKKQCFCHQHHLHDPSYWDMLINENKVMGTLAVHCEYAEAYLTELPKVSGRWNRKFKSILMNLL